MRHHTIGHLESEAEHFRRLDAELLEKMRQRDALEEHHRRMAEACQTRDPRVVEALERLGFTESTANLLCIVPTVHMAWADGSVSHAEREHILAIAKLHGVEEHTPAHKQLTEWLDKRPPEELFQGALSAIRTGLDALPPLERKARKDDVLEMCFDIAVASGRLLGHIRAGKRKLLEHIQEKLEREEPAGAMKAVSGQ